MPTSKTLAVFDAASGQPPTTGYPQLDLRGDHLVVDFDDATDESTNYLAVLPQGYAGNSLEIVLTWAATSATAGNVLWQAEYERHAIGDATYGTFDLDASNFGTAASEAATAPSVSGEVARTTIALSVTDAQSPASGETYRIRITRLATNAADTMAGDAELLAAELREV